MKLTKMSPVLVGLLQAIGVAIYCSLVAIFFRLMNSSRIENSPEIWGIALMLFLLVFSAAVCGILVFGYPIYLIAQRDVKKALNILAYTLLYAIIIFVLILLIIIL